MNTVSRSPLAMMLLLAIVPRVAAQEGFGAVVCVGSELETMAGGEAARRVVQKDVHLVYRAAVEFADGEETEADLREVLKQMEVRCVWSEPGNTHVVVLKYTGVMPLGVTTDPEDPKFGAFSVGYGTDWDGAEANARLDSRFDAYYDGSGYEVIVRERWTAGGAQRAVAAVMEPGTVFRDCEECPEMVVVPAGSFMMGSPESEEGRWVDEGPRHRVTIGSPFAVGVYEVTFAEWDACVEAGGCGRYRPGDGGWGRGRRPVIHVSWEDARQYVWWLTAETGVAYRLLTEAEWEYAARAGTQAAWPWGKSESGQCHYGNGLDAAALQANPRWTTASCNDGYVRTAPVGMFEPNGFGLYDVLGNVYEWTRDCWSESYAGAPADGGAWISGDCSLRVMRGGAWNVVPWFLRSAYRDWHAAGHRSYVIGFRVARTIN